MSERVECPVCEEVSPSEQYPRHLVESHLADGLRERYAYSAAWAGAFAVLAVVVLAAQVGRFVYGRPVGDLAAQFDGPKAVELVASVSSDLLVPVGPMVVGIGAVAVARGPVQAIRRGWQPSKLEYLYVLVLGLPVAGPVVYGVGATRRFLSVRFAREKTVIAVVTAQERLSQAEAALDEGRDADAAANFEDAAARLGRLQADDSFANDRLEARIAALQRACGTAVGICERNATASSDPPEPA